jgi:hypothetical protein
MKGATVMLAVEKKQIKSFWSGRLATILGLACVLGLASQADAASLRLTWVNNSTVAGHIIEIERCIVVAPATTCTNFVKINQVTYPATTFTDTTLAEVTKARYQIRATSAGTFSNYSNQAENTTGLNDPTGLVVDRP